MPNKPSVDVEEEHRTGRMVIALFCILISGPWCIYCVINTFATIAGISTFSISSAFWIYVPPLIIALIGLWAWEKP